jgi:DNA-binding SARP family transcriptional activator
MSVLKVHLFGNVHIELCHDNDCAMVAATHKVQSLLAYLVLHRDRCHSRDILLTEFWPEYDQHRARNALNTTLWRLRSAIEPEGVPGGTFVTSSPSGEVGFDTGSSVWLDVANFETDARRFLAKPADQRQAADAEALEQALSLYTGDLLEGFYDDWALRERERLRLLYLKCQAHLLTWYRTHHRYGCALACGRQILEHDPLREEIHREMMRLYLKTGRRPLAVQQYHTLCNILSEELGISPMASTQALYRQIAAAESPAGTLPQPADSPPLLQRALEQLVYATETLAAAHQDLQRAVLLVERLSRDAG